MNTLFHFCRSKEENNNGPVVKKFKSSTLDNVNSIIEVKIKKQNKDLHDWRNQLVRELEPDELVDILEANDQFVPKDDDDVSCTSNFCNW